jgi:formylglycine-generating enzyme required for sulfatase activity
MNRIVLILVAVMVAIAGTTSADTRQGLTRTPNPFADVVVGEWVEYAGQGDSYTAKLVSTVTSIDGDTVTVVDEIFLNGKDKPSKTVHKVDRAKPLSPHFQLGTHKLIGKPITADVSTTESINIGSQEIETLREDFALRSQFGTTRKKLWTSLSVPVAGVVKRSSVSQLSSSTLVLVRYGIGEEAKKQSTDKKQLVGGRKQFSNGVGGHMVHMPASSVMVGQSSRAAFLMKVRSAATQEDKLLLLTRIPPTRPEVIDNAFWIGKHEVTIGQFRKFVESTQYKTETQRSRVGGTGRHENGEFGQDAKFTWQSYGFEATDDCPVVNVTHGDAVAFCKWLSDTDGIKYRLPTEIEWEYACRGKSRTVYSSGDKVADLNGFANVADQSLAKAQPGLPWAADFDDGFAYLSPVGSFQPNQFGLHDMHGNALEYCGTPFAMYAPLYDGTPATASALEAGTSFAVRGGNWFNDPQLAGAASRSGAEPKTAMSLIGFRIVAESAPKKK